MRNKILALTALSVLAGAANAAVTFDFSVVYSGDEPGGTSPWATLVIENDGSDKVNMTLTHNSGSAEGQFLVDLYLNMSSIPGDLSVDASDPIIKGYDFGDNFTNNAGQQFDFMISMETTNKGGGEFRLEPGESVSWSLSGTGLDESMFNILSDPSGESDPVYALLHLQGIEGGGSSKLAPVPEPATMAGLGLGVLALARRRRRS